MQIQPQLTFTVESARSRAKTFVGAGEGIRTPEPLRDRVLSPPREKIALRL